jgi:hypothetical protein
MENKETLEEAGKDYIENTMKFSFDSLDTKTQANRMLKCVEFGAKWQAERMYSEEDMLKCWNAAYIDALAIDEETYKPLFFEDFIKQFKNK